MTGDGHATGRKHVVLPLLGQVVGGVVEGAVVESGAGGGFEVAEGNFVDAAGGEVFDVELNGIFVAGGNLAELVVLLVFHGAAVGPLGLVGEGTDGDVLVGGGVFGEVLGEGELEALFGELDGGDVEGVVAGGGDALEAFRVFAPAADGLADVEGLAVGGEAEAVVAGTEAAVVDEVGAGALELAIHFVEHDAGDAGAVVVGEEELAGEGLAEGSVAGDLDGVGGGAVEFAVGDLDGGEGAVFVVGVEVVAVGEEGVFVRGPIFVPDKAGGVAVEVTFFDEVERGGGFPVALVVAAPESAGGVLVDAVGHAEAGGDGGEGAVGGVVEDPAAVFDGGEVAAAAAEGGVFVAGVEEGGAVVGGGADGEVVAAFAIGAEGVGLVVVAAEAPAVGEAVVGVGRGRRCWCRWLR